MFSMRTQLINLSGLHARPASDFVKLAKSFHSKVTVCRVNNPTAVNAKSIVMLLSQGFCQGTDIEIAAEGEDEQAAVHALVALVNSGFGET